MIIKQMVNGQAGEYSCAGHSTMRAQRPVVRIASPRTMKGLFIDLQRGKTVSLSVMRWADSLARELCDCSKRVME